MYLPLPSYFTEHNMRDTYQFACEPIQASQKLIWLLVACNRDLERYLDTLAAKDHKDTLK